MILEKKPSLISSTNNLQSQQIQSQLSQQLQQQQLKSQQEQESLKNEANDWTIHQASNGLPYYYNIKTKKSTWIKPDCLQEEVEEEDETAGWKEYETAEGHKFYYNQKLQKSLTKMPDELKNLQNKQHQKKNAALDGVASKAVDFMRKNQQAKQDGNQQEKFSINITSNIDDNAGDENDGLEQVTKEQATQIFMGLLKDKQISLLHKWDQCQKLIQNDERFNIIKAISEKKKTFHDYIDQLKSDQRKQLQSKQEQDKDNFLKMLEEKNLDSSTKFYKVQQQLMADARWKAIDERERENLFQDYLDETYSNEKNKQRNQKKENMKLLREFMLKNEKIDAQTKWNDFKEMYKDHPVFNELQSLDQLSTFSEVIQELEITEKDKRKEIRRLEEAKNRDNFRKLLKEHIEKKTLTYKTKWKNFMLILKDDTRLLNMFGQRGSTPKELFEDELEILKESHKKIKNDLKQLLKKNNISMNSELTFKQFNNKLNSDDEYKQLSEVTKQIYYQYYQEKAKSKEKEVSRKIKKAQKKLTKVLKKQIDINQDSKYLDFKQIIEQFATKYSALTNQQREMVFDEYIKSLKDPNQIEIENAQEQLQRLKSNGVNLKKMELEKNEKEKDYDENEENNEKDQKKKEKDKKKKKKESKQNKENQIEDEGEIIINEKDRKRMLIEKNGDDDEDDGDEKEEGEQSVSPEQKKDSKKHDNKKKKKKDKSDKKNKNKKKKKKQKEQSSSSDDEEEEQSVSSSSSSRSRSRSRTKSKSKYQQKKKKNKNQNDSSEE